MSHSTDEILRVLHEEIALHAESKDRDPSRLWLAYMDEWNVTGVSAPPMEIVLRQREKFFQGVRFRGIKEVLRDGFVRGCGGRMV